MVTPPVYYCVSVATQPQERECLLFQWGPDIIKDLSGPLGDDDVRMLYGIVEHPTKERVQES
jgi:hypothetical protein